MATFSFQGKEIFYREYGEGEPFIMLNGIFMSTASWAPFTSSFSARRRLILVDMFDQGRTAKMDAEYGIALQKDLVLALLDHLELARCDMLGMSYGGEVAMTLAAAAPERIRKLILSNTPPYTSKWLQDIGASWVAACEACDGKQFFKAAIPIVYSPRFYEEHHNWMMAQEKLYEKSFNKETFQGFLRLIRSTESHDQREQLHCITAKTLLISAELDFLTPPYFQRDIAARIPCATHLTISDAGHGVMYEKPTAFASAVLGFLDEDTSLSLL